MGKGGEKQEIHSDNQRQRAFLGILSPGRLKLHVKVSVFEHTVETPGPL